MSDPTRPRRRATTSDAGASPSPAPPDVPLDHWAALIREARRSRRLSQAALAEAAGVTQQTISKVETADICPHDRLKLRLATVLDVPPAELFPWPTRPVS